MLLRIRPHRLLRPDRPLRRTRRLRSGRRHRAGRGARRAQWPCLWHRLPLQGAGGQHRPARRPDQRRQRRDVYEHRRADLQRERRSDHLRLGADRGQDRSQRRRHRLLRPVPDRGPVPGKPEGERFAGALRAPLSDRHVPATLQAAGALSAATGTGDLSFATGTGDLTKGSIFLTGVTGAFAVGQQIEGAGIPEGTTIAAVDSVAEELTLSNPATADGTGVALKAASKTVTNLATEAGAFAAGQAIEGAGIPAGTTVAAVNSEAETLTLSKVPTAGGEGVPLAAGSKVVSEVQAPGPWPLLAGQAIEGAGIPAGTTIAAVDSEAETLTLSAPATEAGEEVALTVAAGPQQVYQQLAGLAPRTGYRYRVVAENPDTANGQAMSFATYGEASPLPDGRAYELVSPNEKAGEVDPTRTDWLPERRLRGMPAGDQPADLPDAELPRGRRGALRRPAVRRRPRLGGRSVPLGPGSGRLGPREPQLLDQDRELAGLLGRPLTRSDRPDRTAAVAGGADPGRACLRKPLPWQGGAALAPLVTAEPPNRDPEGVGGGANRFALRYAAANAGTAAVAPFAHIAFEANDALSGAVPGVAPAAPEVAPSSQECSVSHCDLYEWAGGQPALVNVLPGNTEAAGEAAIGSGRLLGEAEGVYEAPNVATAISADGRVVFFSSEQTGHSYARIGAARTLEVPGPASCKASEPLGDRACFLVASADGHQVLLADGQLYALNGAESAFEATIDLSGGEGGFEGILGAAADLSRIYFVDTKALTGGEENANGEAAQEGADNLYLAEGGATVFVGRLLSNDNSIALAGRFGAWKASAANRTAQVTPDGGQLAFMSKAPLTRL